MWCTCCSGMYSRRSALRTLALAGAGTFSQVVPGAEHCRVVDVHSHFWSLEYLDSLRASSDIETSTGADGNVRIHYPGNTTTIVRGHYDLDYRERVLDEHGIDMQVLSFSNPGTHVQPPARALTMTAEFAGFDRLLAGSDYPQKIGSLEKMVTSIDALNAPEHIDAVCSGNASRLLAIR